MKVTNIKIPEDTKRNFFKNMMNGNERKKTLKKPCEDCAITYNFYTPIADELLKEDKDTQGKVLDRWYCHNDFSECCKGALNYVDSMRKKQC